MTARSIWRSIVMGAGSELGPIEPLVNGIPCTVLTQPQIAAQNFPLHMYCHVRSVRPSTNTKARENAVICGNDEW
jgi:hypothetical protein